MSIKKRKKKPKKSINRIYSKINQHKLDKKKLVPPFLQNPNLNLTSWMNDRLPEMLWAALIISNMSREYGLAIFRRCINYISELPDKLNYEDIGHTALSKLSDNDLKDFLKVLIQTDAEKRILASLLKLENLPAKNIWAEFLKEEDASWGYLMNAIANTLDHQSQETTDCRWLKIMSKVVVGKFFAQPGFETREYLEYPNFGDMRKVRPSIRALEVAISGMSKVENEWPKIFWDYCYENTDCYPLGVINKTEKTFIDTKLELVFEVIKELMSHCHKTRKDTLIDSKHSTIFGISIYCLAILEECLRIGNSTSILGRFALRTIVECYILLSYLIKKDDILLWDTYRNYGAGQAKLAFLKLNENEDNVNYVNVEILNALANEDMWQEFLAVDLGHWNKTDLRKMSEETGLKNDYDKYYNWTSNYCHGHWGAIRESMFDVCGNPLHRLHQIPAPKGKLPDVISDICNLVDNVLYLVSKCYPTFNLRVSIIK